MEPVFGVGSDFCVNIMAKRLSYSARKSLESYCINGENELSQKKKEKLLDYLNIDHLMELSTSVEYNPPRIKYDSITLARRAELAYTLQNHLREQREDLQLKNCYLAIDKILDKSLTGKSFGRSGTALQILENLIIDVDPKVEFANSHFDIKSLGFGLLSGAFVYNMTYAFVPPLVVANAVFITSMAYSFYKKRRARKNSFRVDEKYSQLCSLALEANSVESEVNVQTV